MKYQICVPQIHCSGCVGLIKLSLEDIFEAVEVDQISKVAKFESDKSFNEVKDELDSVFDELSHSGYAYDELVEVN